MVKTVLVVLGAIVALGALRRMGASSGGGGFTATAAGEGGAYDPSDAQRVPDAEQVS